MLCERCHLSWDGDLWLVGRERKTVALGQYTDENRIKIKWENVLCQTDLQFSFFAFYLFNICNTKRDGGENYIFFNNLNDIFLTTSKNLQLQMQASVAVLPRHKML